MGAGGERLQAVLEGYDRFLIEKELSGQKERPHLVRRVREFLLFARAHGAFTFEQTLDLFLARGNGLARSPGWGVYLRADAGPVSGPGERIGTKPWQLQQAAHAVRIYCYQYRGG